MAAGCLCGCGCVCECQRCTDLFIFCAIFILPWLWFQIFIIPNSFLMKLCFFFFVFLFLFYKSLVYLYRWMYISSSGKSLCLIRRTISSYLSDDFFVYLLLIWWKRSNKTAIDWFIKFFEKLKIFNLQFTSNYFNLGMLTKKKKNEKILLIILWPIKCHFSLH